jgi:hypothetical protein
MNVHHIRARALSLNATFGAHGIRAEVAMRTGTVPIACTLQSNE